MGKEEGKGETLTLSENSERKFDWDKYYHGLRDGIIRNLGVLDPLVRKDDLGAKWDSHILSLLRNLLEITNALWKDVGLIVESVEELESKVASQEDREKLLDRRTNIFQIRLKQYEPLLAYLGTFVETRIREEEEKVRKIKQLGDESDKQNKN
jgi:hypothetical protein